jgi:hypothetical protein
MLGRQGQGNNTTFRAQDASYSHENRRTHVGGSGGGGGGGAQRDESYSLLLELSSQEPTMQACFKIIESTCLARGIDLEIAGSPPSEEFRKFISR